jgi:hypothetical protein
MKFSAGSFYFQVREGKLLANGSLSFVNPVESFEVSRPKKAFPTYHSCISDR